MMRATQQALSIPTFRTPADCTPLVLGGLWPAELQHVTAETASLAEYLNRGLRRIASSANEKLRAIREAGLNEPTRKAEEARVVNVARAFAVLRAESTIRHLRKEPLGLSPEYLSLGAAEEGGPTQVVNPVEEPPRQPSAPPGVPPSAQPQRAPEPVESDEFASTTAQSVDLGDPEGLENFEEDEPEVITPDTPRPGTRPEPVLIESVSEVVVPQRPREPDEHRLRRLVQYVARQEPGLKWEVGLRADGTTVLVTDLAHGWIPPSIEMPAGVTLLGSERRQGNAAALLGPAALSATSTPGDPFADAMQFDVTTTSPAVRRTEPIEDLGWQLTEAPLARRAATDGHHDGQSRCGRNGRGRRGVRRSSGAPGHRQIPTPRPLPGCGSGGAAQLPADGGYRGHRPR
jgi:hypothetical protein